MNTDEILFGKVTFGKVLNDIYNNSKSKEKQIKDLIESLKPFVTDTSSALMVVPLIKEYLDVSVKNDDALIKMAAIVQRAMANNKGESEDILSEAEKEQLLKVVKETYLPVSKDNEVKLIT